MPHCAAASCLPGVGFSASLGFFSSPAFRVKFEFIIKFASLTLGYVEGDIESDLRKEIRKEKKGRGKKRRCVCMCVCVPLMSPADVRLYDNKDFQLPESYYPVHSLIHLFFYHSVIYKRGNQRRTVIA